MAGRKANTWIFPLTDINECSEETSKECDSNAYCTNTEGSYNCTCHEGYSGTGKECNGKYDFR